METGKRVLQLIDKLAVSRQAFSERIDISVAVLSHISSGRNKPSLEMIQRILTEYPQVSADWLVSGIGAMFRETPRSLDTRELEDKIHTLRLILKDQNQHIDMRLKEINDLVKASEA